jgi:histidyl-tRNA synthetase
MQLIDGPKGAPDWLPPEVARFNAVETILLEAARLYGYARVRTPVFEHTEVFTRGVGDTTDVVQKEMYTFTDKGGRSITLRPESTAGVVRAALTAGVPRAGGLPVKYAYSSEHFRYERPQAGRHRQHTSVGVEALGSDDPELDAEVVLLGWEALRRTGLDDVVLRLNNLGDRRDRADYHARLNGYLDGFADRLPPDVAERRARNPLRAFDSKAPGMAEIMAHAPLLPDHTSAEAKAHHELVVARLESAGVPLSHDPHLVRGLDYYNRTTFEYQVRSLGAQDAVGGGGRYDGLAQDLGWPERFPGVGVVTDQALSAEAFGLLGELRAAGIAADRAYGGRSVKAQMKVADRSGARFVLLLGPGEVERGLVTLKDLGSGEQREVERPAVIGALASAQGSSSGSGGFGPAR